MAARMAASSSSSPATVTRLAERATATAETPATCSTSEVMASRQWPQLIPGTEYVSCSVVWLMVEIPSVVSLHTIPPRGTSARGIRRRFDAREPVCQYPRRVQGAHSHRHRPDARVVDEDRCCINVLVRISVVQAAVDKLALGLLDQHARHCAVEGHGEG